MSTIDSRFIGRSSRSITKSTCIFFRFHPRTRGPAIFRFDGRFRSLQIDSVERFEKCLDRFGDKNKAEYSSVDAVTAPYEAIGWISH